MVYHTCYRELEPNSESAVSVTPVQPPGTVFLLTYTTLLILIHSKNDSRVYSLFVLISDYCMAHHDVAYSGALQISY